MSIPARVAAEAAQADADLAALATAAAPPAPPANDPPPAPPAAPPPAPTATPTSLEAELARQNQQLQTLAGRLEATQREKDVLAGRLEELGRRPAEPAAPAAPPKPLVTETDIKEYGEDLIGLIGRVVTQSVGARIDALATQIAAVGAKVNTTSQQAQHAHQLSAQTLHDRYLAALDSAMPGWEAVNVDPAFEQWLEGQDLASGKTRKALLADAHNAADAIRVTYIFKLYKPDLGTGAPANPPPAPAPQAPPATGHIDPATLAAPASNPSAPPPASPPAAPLWTQADVERLYDDKQKKRITNEVFAQREQEYLRALAEGRVSTS